jgi:transposase
MESKYSKEFREDALKLSEKEGVMKACEQLGLKPRNIYDWRRVLKRKKKALTKKINPGESLDEAFKRISKENEELKEANTILKKAMGFLVGR